MLIPVPGSCGRCRDKSLYVGGRVCAWVQRVKRGSSGEVMWFQRKVGIPAAEMGGTREWKEEVNEGLDHGVLSV